MTKPTEKPGVGLGCTFTLFIPSQTAKTNKNLLQTVKRRGEVSAVWKPILLKGCSWPLNSTKHHGPGVCWCREPGKGGQGAGRAAHTLGS